MGDGKIKRMNDINVHLEDYRASMVGGQTEEEDEYVFDMYDHQRSVTMVINNNNDENDDNGMEVEEECPTFGGGALSVTLADDNTPYESPFDNDAKNGLLNGNVSKMFTAYLINNPVSQHGDDETDDMDTKSSMRTVKEKHYHEATCSTLEIQGLINV